MKFNRLMSTAFAASITLFSSVSWTQEDIPLENWSLPGAPLEGTRSLMAATSNPSTFVAVTPCRVADTRNSGIMYAGETRTFSVSGSGCGVPVAGAYSLNFTVVPSGQLGYLTAWPTGSTQPTVSTLNSPNGAILANAAIVPASNGSINVFVTNPTHVIVDINGYFDAINTSTSTSVKVCVFGNAAFFSMVPVPSSFTVQSCQHISQSAINQPYFVGCISATGTPSYGPYVGIGGIATLPPDNFCGWTY